MGIERGLNGLREEGINVTKASQGTAHTAGRGVGTSSFGRPSISFRLVPGLLFHEESLGGGRIGADQEHLPAKLGQSNGRGTRQGGLADTALAREEHVPGH